MNDVIINTMIILFPILIYLVFSCYNLLTNKKVTKLIFIVTMCTSLYFSLCYNLENTDGGLGLIFCNIPALICYLKKDTKLGMIFSLIVVLVIY